MGDHSHRDPSLLQHGRRRAINPDRLLQPDQHGRHGTMQASLPMTCRESHSNTSTVLSDFQSQGRCFGNCTDIGAALAIVQWKSCWCADLIPNPSDQKSLSSCQDKCPGYPDDYCGARGGGGGAYGYMQLKKPSGTAPPGVTNTRTTSVSSHRPSTAAMSCPCAGMSQSSLLSYPHPSPTTGGKPTEAQR